MLDIIDDFLDSFRKDERVAELGQVARENNFKFKKREQFSEQKYRLKAFQLFKGKKAKRIKGILYDEKQSFPLRARMYDYIYYSDSKKKKTTVIEIISSKLDLSRFEIRPKGALKRMTEMFVAGEKIFADSIAFHAEYELLSLQNDDLRFELNEQALDLIASKKGIRIEGEGEYLLMYHKNKQIPAIELMHEYDFMLELMDCLISGYSGEEYV